MHVSRSESTYTVFYEIENKLSSEWYLLDLHFSVLASSNAHILISETKNASYDIPVYEIVLGAGSNKYSDIRREIRSKQKATASTVDGLIEVGNENDNTSFLAWKDKQPLKVKYFSFGTWTNINARWFFDCKEINESDPSNLTSLTTFEKLRNEVFQNYNIFARPVLDETTVIDVLLHLTPQYVSLDERTSKLSIKGIGFMQWIDEKLKWDPNDYDHITTIKLSVDDIWIPNLKLHDQKIDLKDIFLRYDGSVIANILMDTNHWCNIEDLSLWPFDTHNCSLTFILDNDDGKIRWLYLSQEQEFFKQPGLASEWIVVSSKIDINVSLDLNEYLDYVQDNSATSLILQLTLKRLSSVYKLIYLPPFFVTQVFTGCKTHVANSSQYSVFHEIENDQRSSWFLFELRFSVLAKSDAHILISETKNISKSTPVYEIVLGAGLNTFSDIRRGLKSLDKVRKSTVNILSSTVYRSFWIRIWTDYLIEVGNEGNNTAFLAWKDENPLKLNYFSFASWGNIYTKWFYDCKEKIHEPNSADERTSKLNIKGLGRMQWIDEKLKWYPKNYSNIDTIKLSDDDIWTPDLRLYDQKISAQDIFLYYNGSVSANILLNANYWCNMED
ncbi:hypothetical protein MML48_2g00011602 [Holotrichia oblita]|uniref:Uncharacterized protein n=1 Tax=Holotrichia oblita TaxID=644536 RepID=A0ACB9TKM0_HOLOL|nr:hypothetical protein MML48_2g00011602 [Holotrichia oblita]